MEWYDILPLIMLLTLAVALFLGYPVAFVLAGVGTAFGLVGYLLGEFPLLAFFNIPLRVWGSLNGSLIYPAVPILLFMGIALEKSGVARELLECLQILLRHLPTNLAVAITLIGIILAPSAGLVGASVVTLALIGLPTMLEQGYKPSLATGSVAAAGTLGIILPPGVMLFFFADYFRIQIGAMFLSTLIPGFALAGLFVLYYIARSLIDPSIAPAKTIVRSHSRLEFIVFVIRSLVLPVALVAAVLGSIVAGIVTPTQSAAVGAVGGAIILGLKQRFTIPVLHEVIIGTALTSAMVFFIIVAATIFSYPFNFFGGPDIIADFLNGLGFEDWAMLLVILGIIFILGFFIDWIEIFVIVLPIFLPLLNAMDFSAHAGSADLAKIWVAVLFALVLQSSFLTPPFGFSLFFVKGAAPATVKLPDVYRGAAPLVAIQLILIAIVMAYPKLAVWLPGIFLNSR